jgi:ABC-type sugar transport system ATPase subunit
MDATGGRGVKAVLTASAPVVSVTDAWKSFGHVQALRGASIHVNEGEIVALYGDNGAGKSTLMRVLLGIIRPDQGAVAINGRVVEMASIRDAQANGVDAVHQDLALAPDLSVLESLFLGHERVHGGVLGRLGFLDRSSMAGDASTALEQLGIHLPSVRRPVRDLSGGQRQATAVARAVMWTSTAILMDEPTAALGARQSDIVCETIVSSAARGLGVLVISHDLPRTLAIAHRVVVLVRGAVGLDAPAKGLTVPEIVEVMVGHLAPAGAAVREGDADGE